MAIIEGEGEAEMGGGGGAAAGGFGTFNMGNVVTDANDDDVNGDDDVDVVIFELRE